MDLSNAKLYLLHVDDIYTVKDSQSTTFKYNRSSLCPWDGIRRLAAGLHTSENFSIPKIEKNKCGWIYRRCKIFQCSRGELLWTGAMRGMQLPWQWPACWLVAGRCYRPPQLIIHPRTAAPYSALVTPPTALLLHSTQEAGRTPISRHQWLFRFILMFKLNNL